MLLLLFSQQQQLEPLPFFSWPFALGCCCCSVTQSCLTLCNPTDCSTPGLSVPHHLPKFAQVHVHCISDAIQPSLILWCPLLLLSSIFPSITDFSNESAVHSTWPKCCNFSFCISPSNEYSGLISLRIDWFDLLVVKGTVSSLLQHHSSKALILWCSAFFGGFPGGSDGKESACNAGDQSSIPGLGRSLEKEMATHCSILVWKIPWTEETGRLHSMGSQRVKHDWATPLSLSTFFMFHLSQSYMTTREIIALTIRTFIGRVISLLALNWAHAMPKVIPISSIPYEKLLSSLIASLIPRIMWRPDCTSVSTPRSPHYMYIKSQVKYHGEESGNL